MLDFLKDVKEEWNESNFYRKNLIILIFLLILLILFSIIGYIIILLLEGNFVSLIITLLGCWFIFCMVKERKK